MADDDDAGKIYIDGDPYTVDDLTFRERRLMRKTVIELNEDDPSFDIGLADPVNDTIPAFVWVIKRRADPDYPMDKVLDLKPVDLDPPAKNGDGDEKRRPTSSGSKKS